MEYSRVVRGLRSFSRAGEIARCVRDCPEWARVIPAYLGGRGLEYPYNFRTRAGDAVRLADWEDLTTVWAVLFGDEYRVDSADRVIVDLGANIGAFTVHAARIARGANIIAVEPFPANFERLRACVQANGLDERVRCRPWAVAGDDGTLTMDGAPEIASHSRCRIAPNDAKQPVEVPCYSLGHVFAAEGLSEVDYLKIDIEGAEYEALAQTPRDVLRIARVVGIECHGDHSANERLWADFSEAGFKPRRIARRPFWTTAEFERC